MSSARTDPNPIQTPSKPRGHAHGLIADSDKVIIKVDNFEKMSDVNIS